MTTIKITHDEIIRHADLLCMLYWRWQDEREYEDFQEYRDRLARDTGWNIVKMTKRPFAVYVDDGTGWAHRIGVTAKSITHQNVPRWRFGLGVLRQPWGKYST